MLKFLIKRLGFCVLAFLGVSLISFLILHLSPGDPARLMLPEGASDAQVEAMRDKLGLNRPLHIQYGVYMAGVIKGDLGTSLFYKQPNTKIILEHLPATAILTLTAVVLSLLISIPLGIIAGVKRGSISTFFNVHCFTRAINVTSMAWDSSYFYTIREV